MTDRRLEIADRLTHVRARIADAARACGRNPGEITLVVITKTFPASDVRLLAELGVRDVGENRHPEAAEKAQACRDLGLRWHYVGQLQTNKARAVAGYADVVHSVDRTKVATALARGRGDPSDVFERPLDCLVQVSLDLPESGAHRGGVAPESALDLAQAVDAHDTLALRGVMAVAPLGADPRPAFARLADVAERVRSVAPQATWISAGMSGDLEAAIEFGATHVRVGSAILGTRPAAR